MILLDLVRGKSISVQSTAAYVIGVKFLTDLLYRFVRRELGVIENITDCKESIRNAVELD